MRLGCKVGTDWPFGKTIIRNTLEFQLHFYPWAPYLRQRQFDHFYTFKKGKWHVSAHTVVQDTLTLPRNLIKRTLTAVHDGFIENYMECTWNCKE